MVKIFDVVSWQITRVGPTHRGVVISVYPDGNDIYKTPFCMVRTATDDITMPYQDYSVLLSNKTLTVLERD